MTDPIATDAEVEALRATAQSDGVVLGAAVLRLINRLTATEQDNANLRARVEGSETVALRERVEKTKRTPGSEEAFAALDLADELIERAYGTDIPKEWNRAYRKVARARSTLGGPTYD